MAGTEAGEMGRARGAGVAAVRRWGASLAVALLLSLTVGASTAPGQEIGLTGYLRTFTAHHDAGFDPPGLDRTTLLNSEVVRLIWTGRLGNRVSFVVHNRLSARVSLAGRGLDAGTAGLGVSVVPTRSLDLSTTLVDDDRLHLLHDIDRLAVTIETRAADLTIGRQAITWGAANIFPVADLWAQFSPFELETEEKPGVDAIRALAYPRDGLELDIIIADRGSWRDLSAGARATLETASADIHAGVGKFWDRLMVLGGVAYLLDKTTLRAEAVLPWSLDDRGWERPRLTLGIDRPGARLTLSAEYHYNGIGAPEVGGYSAALADPRLRRGETYFLGRHYLGALAAWTPDADGRLTFSTSVLASLTDRSMALVPALNYDLGQRLRLSAGAVVGVGSRPGGPGIPRSEFGSHGRLGWVGGSLFF